MEITLIVMIMLRILSTQYSKIYNKSIQKRRKKERKTDQSLRFLSRFYLSPLFSIFFQPLSSSFRFHCTQTYKYIFPFFFVLLSLFLLSIYFFLFFFVHFYPSYSYQYIFLFFFFVHSYLSFSSCYSIFSFFLSLLPPKTSLLPRWRKFPLISVLPLFSLHFPSPYFSISNSIDLTAQPPNLICIGQRTGRIICVDNVWLLRTLTRDSRFQDDSERFRFGKESERDSGS